MAHEAAPEQLLDVFRTAALSVTKLYKSSITAQAKARSEGYQDCLDDLLQFLDKSNLGLGDGEGWKVRAWANERLGARDGSPQVMESDDDAEKPETTSSSEIHRSNSTSSMQHAQPHQHLVPPQQHSALAMEVQAEPETESPVIEEIAVDESEATLPYETAVPTQETFEFRSSVPYPGPQNQDAQNQLNFGSLHLSDTRPHDNTISHPNISTPRSSRSARHLSGSRGRRANQMTSHGARAGTKRRLDYEELFGLANLGQFKDHSASKRRHI